MTTIKTASKEKAPKNVLKNKPVRILGMDIANSTVKLCLGEGIENLLAYPNTSIRLSESTKSLLLGEIASGSREITEKETIFTITEEGNVNDYHIGLVEGKVESSYQNTENRYKSVPFQREFLCAVSKIAENGDSFVICTGLPSSDYNKRGQLDINGNETADVWSDIKSLEGTHAIYKNGVLTEFTIEKIYIELQPRGSFLSAGYKFQNGEIYPNIEEVLTAKRVLIIDGGFGTTDGAVIDPRDKQKLKETYAIDTAMNNVYRDLRDELKNSYNRVGRMPLIEIESDIRQYNSLDGVPQDVFERAWKKVKFNNANKVWNQIVQEIKEINDMSYVIFTGGMMLALEEELKELIKGEFITIFAERPQTANCEGYYIRAFDLWSKTGGKA